MTIKEIKNFKTGQVFINGIKADTIVILAFIAPYIFAKKPHGFPFITKRNDFIEMYPNFVLQDHNPIKPEITITVDSQTQRGFTIGEFKDKYGASCSIQKSSAAMYDAIWLGISDPDPKIMASHAKQFGVETEETTGWVPYPIPKEVLISTRMHLTRDQVADLLPILTNFVLHGELK